MMKKARNDFLYGLLFPVIVILLWELMSRQGLTNKALMPSPSEVLIQFWVLIENGLLWTHLKASILRAFAGFAIGAALGLLMGFLTGYVRRLEQLLDPTFQMLRTLPFLALTPLFILWFGIGETSKVLMIAFGSFFSLYVNTFLGIRSVDRKLFEVARVLEFSKWKQFTRLIIPSSLPNILLGIRLSLGIAWLVLVVAEMMGANEGIGSMIQDARQFSQTKVVMVGILIFAIIGKLSDSLVRVLERKWLKWQDGFGK